MYLVNKLNNLNAQFVQSIICTLKYSKHDETKIKIDSIK